MKKKISVLMTVYNAENFIEKSIKSILDQTYKNFELIIIDDFSSDNSSKIIAKFYDKRIKFYKVKKKLGRTKALNFGLKKCNSKLITIQDADDIAHKHRLLEALGAFNTNKNIGLVFSGYQVIDENDKLKKKFNKFNYNNFSSKLKYKNLIPHSSVTFKKDIIKNNFLFYNEKYLYAQDYHLILSFLKFSKIFLINKNLVQIRNHINNMSNIKIYKKIRIQEDIQLLKFSEKHLTPNIFEIFFIKYYKLKNYLKLFLDFLGV